MTVWLKDDNGNKCSVEYFGTKEAAQAALDSLKNCENCINCSDCSRCSDCSGCSGCSDKLNARIVETETPAFVVPTIPNIHQRVYEAVTAPDHGLEMDAWHTCETTHCRGGWVVTLAGAAGKKLEDQTSTLFAAMQIYRASSPLRISPTRFFEPNAVAMADMKKMAALEAMSIKL
jgi:hypothetical protein